MQLSSLVHRLVCWSIAPIGVAVLAVSSMQPMVQAQDNPPAAGQAQPAMENGQQVLTRGPVHEAFGQPTVFNPKPGLGITKKPPQPVEELPPDEKPEGENVAWLGGYWSWDEDKNDFMWVSGFWRVLPPGRQWIPGYWNEDAGQFQWVSGYWASAEQQEEQIIQQPPPESLEQGAPPTAPSQDHIWSPGTWVYRDTRYLWRPGYWIAGQPGWSWVPACYTWTPGGYIFVDGYWDWSIRRRGILFAPCYFDYAVCYRPGFIYRPAVCLDIDVITPHFFCRPAYGHYYFGDYYATSYLSIGITPWFNFTYARGPRFYSSDFVYYENYYRRTNPNWRVDIRLNYERHRDNINLRPARTFVTQQTVINNITVNNINKTNVNVNNMALAKPLKTYTSNLNKNADSPIKVERINDNRAREFGKNATEVRKVAMERVSVEKKLAVQNATSKTGTTAGTINAVRTFNLPKSPIVSKMPTNTADEKKTPNVGNIGQSVTRIPPPVPGENKNLKAINRSKSSGEVIGGTTSNGTGATGSKTGPAPVTGGNASTSGNNTGTGTKVNPGTGNVNMKTGPGIGNGASSKINPGTGSTGTKTGSGPGNNGSGTGSKIGGGSSSSGITGTKTGSGLGNSGSSAGSKVGGASSGTGRTSGSAGAGSGSKSSSGSGKTGGDSSSSNSKKDKPN